MNISTDLTDDHGIELIFKHHSHHLQAANSFKYIVYSVQYFLTHKNPILVITHHDHLFTKKAEAEQKY